MGEKQTKPFQLSFNGSLKVDFQGSHVTSDGGLILVRELDERLGLGELIDEHLSDSRQGTNKQFTLLMGCCGTRIYRAKAIGFRCHPSKTKIGRFALGRRCWRRARQCFRLERRAGKRPGVSSRIEAARQIH